MDSVLNSNDVPTGSQQPALYAVVAVTLTLAAIAVALRFLARRLNGVSLWLDDWLALSALVLSAGFDVNTVIATTRGFGLHVPAINEPVIEVYHDVFLSLWIGELLYSFAIAAAKLTFLALYWRIFPVSSIKLPIKIMGAAVICWLIARVTAVIFHCVPVQGFWDRTIPANCEVDDRKFFFGTVLPHLCMDLIILALPAPYIKSLQMSWQQKFGIFGMFLLGGFVCFASVVQLIICFKLDVTSMDVTWIYAPVAIWATAETNLAVVAACIPLFRPIYRFVTGRRNRLQRTDNSMQYTNDSRTWNGKSKNQASSILKSAHSDSTQQLAMRGDEGSGSFSEDRVHNRDRSLEMNRELDCIALSQINQARV